MLKPDRQTWFWVQVWDGPSLWWDYKEQCWRVNQNGEKIYLRSVDMQDNSSEFARSNFISSSVCTIKGWNRAKRMAKRLLRILPNGSSVVISNRREEYIITKGDL